MTLIQDILGLFRGYAEELRIGEMPSELEVKYPSGSPGEGTPAGRFLLQRDDEGCHQYVWHAMPRSYEPEEAIAEWCFEHMFGDLSSLKAFITTLKDDPDYHPETFVACPPFEAACVQTLTHGAEPERGTLMVNIRRHPSWLRWSAKAGKGQPVDLNHQDLADLLLDNREDLEQPQVADVLASFRSARTVKYNADLDSGSAMGVQVEWTSGTAAKVSDVKVPREFAAKIPVYVWPDEGAPDKHTALFRLRVMPPKSSSVDGAPVFRVTWVNAEDVEIESARALAARIRTTLGDTSEVFVGSPSVQHIVVPSPAVQSEIEGDA